MRRGRYAEFDLVYDRITHSGLHGPEAKHESILMALPPYAVSTYILVLQIHEGKSGVAEIIRGWWVGQEALRSSPEISIQPPPLLTLGMDA